MPIAVQCGCGKTFRVKDEFAGKKARCPACGAIVPVPAECVAAETAAPSADVGLTPKASAAPSRSKAAATGTRFDPVAAAARRPVTQTPRFALSPKAMIFIGLLVGVPTLIFLAKIGPVRAMDQWQEMRPQMMGWTEDVVLKICLEQYKGVIFDEYTRPPSVQTVNPDEPLVMITLPKKIFVQGRSTEGRYKGTFFTREKRFELEIGVSSDSQVIQVKSHVNEKGECVIDEEKPLP